MQIAPPRKASAAGVSSRIRPADQDRDRPGRGRSSPPFGRPGPGERVRPGDEADRGREQAEVDDPGGVRVRRISQLVDQARPRPRAGERRGDAGEEDRHQRRHVLQHDLLRHDAACVAERREQAEDDSEAAGRAEGRRPAGRSPRRRRTRSRSRRRAPAESPRASSRPASSAIKIGPTLTRSAAVPASMRRSAALSRDAVGAEPEHAAERDQRKVAGAGERFPAVQHEQPEDDRGDHDPSERDRARGEVVPGLADPDERRRPEDDRDPGCSERDDVHAGC